MLKKKINVPTVLLLTDIVRDAALQVRPVSDAVAEEYADHLEALPAVTVWDVEGRYLLADGWHRCRAHELAGVLEVRVIVMKGTIEQAKLFVAMCDIRLGVRRNRAAKRQAVLLVLGTEKGMEWSDRKIGEHCGVSHTFVAQMKARLNSGKPQDADEPVSGDAKIVRPVVAVGGNVATHVPERDSEDAAVNDNVPAQAAPNSNVATASAIGSGTSEANETDGGGSVAKEANAAPRAKDRRKAAEPEVEARQDEQCDAALDDADPPGFLDDAQPADAALFRGVDRVTVGDVVRQAEALLDACEDDAERREALGQLLDALSGMMAVLDDGDPSYDEAEEFDAE